MDKETLSQYGWIIICILIIGVLLAFASPLGTFITDSTLVLTDSVVGTVEKGIGVEGDEKGLIAVPDAEGKTMVQMYVLNNMVYEKYNIPINTIVEDPGSNDFDAVIKFRDGAEQNIIMKFDSGTETWRYDGTYDGASIRFELKPYCKFSYPEGSIPSPDSYLLTAASIKDGEDYNNLESLTVLGATIQYENVATYGWIASQSVSDDTSRVTRIIFNFKDGTQKVYEPNFNFYGNDEIFGHGFTNTGDTEFSFDANITSLSEYTYFFVADEVSMMGFIAGSSKDISTITIEQDIDGALEMATYEVIEEE